MAILQAHRTNSVDALALGCVQGAGIGDPTANRNLISQALSSGKSVFIPAGIIEIDTNITVDGVDGVSIYGEGEGSIIRCTAVGRRMLQFRNSNLVTVRNLKLEHVNRTTDVTVSASSNAGVAFEQCTNVTAADCHITGVPGYAIVCTDCVGVAIHNNKLWGNQGSETIGSMDEDITINRTPSGSTRMVSITNNLCLSNNHVGIQCNNLATQLKINNNMVIACDRNLAPVTAEPGLRRKEGIVCTYEMAGWNGESEIQCNDNTIRNTRWAGIYINSNPASDNPTGGYSGTVNGNNVRNTCHAKDTGLAQFKRNGITVEQFREIIISDNVVVDVKAGDPSLQTNAGIGVGLTSAGVPDNTGKLSRAVISNNHVSDVEGFGIQLSNQINDLIIDGNLIQDCQEGALFMTLRSATGGTNPETNSYGKMTITSNRMMTSKLTGTRHMVFVKPLQGRMTFRDNYLEVTDGAWPASNRWLLFVDDHHQSDVSGNEFMGNGSTFCNGVRFDNIQGSGKLADLRVDENEFKDCQYGIWDQGSADTLYVGNSNRYVNVPNPVFSQQGFLSGRFVGGSNNIEAHYTPIGGAPPSNTNFEAGDSIRNLDASVTGVSGWQSDGNRILGVPKEFLSADQFNVPTDGTTDAVPAIQACIDEAVSQGVPRVMIPPRRYSFQSTLSLPNGTATAPANLELWGNGSIIDIAAGTLAIERPWTDGADGNEIYVHTPKIRGFQFYGADTTSHAIELRRTSSALVQDCFFQGCGKAIHVVFGLYARLSRCHMRDCLNPLLIESGLTAGVTPPIPGVHAASNALMIDQCRMSTSNTASIPLTIRQSGNIRVQNTVFEGSDADVVIDVDDASTPGGGSGYLAYNRLSFSDCWFEYNGSVNRLFRTDTRHAQYHFSACAMAGTGLSTASRLFQLVDNTRGATIEIDGMHFTQPFVSSIGTTRWFEDDPNNADQNRWIFRNNYIHDPTPSAWDTSVGGAPYDFTNSALWQGIQPSVGTNLVDESTWYNTVN